MPNNEYHFTSNWRAPGTVQEVREILNQPLDLPRWWPAVYLEATSFEDGSDSVRLHTRGWLPYQLYWDLHLRPSNIENEIVIDATGDLEGQGIWHLEQQGPTVAITFDWTVRANKPILDALSPVLKPVFAANHRWAMQQGEASLRLELARRRAYSEQDRAAIDAPPPPNDDKKVWTAVGATVVALLVLSRLRRGRK